jgi:hypothetical protein
MRYFLIASLALVLADARPAHACGGCLLAATPVAGGSQSPSVVTDHRIVLSLSGSTTTLWDQLEYQGDPDGFAWLLPVRGTVDVAVGSDRFVDTLAQLTAPTIKGPSVVCRAGAGSTGVGDYDYSSGGGCGGSSEASTTTVRTDDGSRAESDKTFAESENDVTVTDRTTAGPYDVVRIRPTVDANVIDWLRRNEYEVPFAIEPILRAYTSEGFDFLAVRLRPGFGVRAMRPIRVTWTGSQVTFPLRLVAAGVAERVGILLFVIGDGRWRTANYPSVVIPRPDLVWDFGVSRSNYTKLRAQLAGDKGFALESSLTVSASKIPEPEPVQEPVQAPPADAGSDVLDASESEVVDDAAETSVTDAAIDVSDAPDAKAAVPTDKEIAFPKGGYRTVTRLRADLSVAALSKDLTVEADTDQSPLSPRIDVLRYENFERVCPSATQPAAATQTSSSSDDGGFFCALTSPSRVRPSIAIVAGAAVLGAIRRFRRRRRS